MQVCSTKAPKLPHILCVRTLLPASAPAARTRRSRSSPDMQTAAASVAVAKLTGASRQWVAQRVELWLPHCWACLLLAERAAVAHQIAG